MIWTENQLIFLPAVFKQLLTTDPVGVLICLSLLYHWELMVPDVEREKKKTSISQDVYIMDLHTSILLGHLISYE